MSRSLIHTAAIMALAFATALALASCDADRPAEDAADDAVAYRCADPCDLYEMAWVGDILLGDAAQAQGSIAMAR